MATAMVIDHTDPTAISDRQNINNLIYSVQELDKQYQDGINRKKENETIDTPEKLLSYQNVFWKSYVDRFDTCNQQMLETLGGINDCCKIIWDYNCIANLYNADIMSLGLSDLESRKLTILLGISDLQKFKCDSMII